MRVRLDYGQEGLDVDLPQRLQPVILEPSKGAPLPDPAEAVLQALDRPVAATPLADLARDRRNAVVVISDKTRPVPYATVLPPILRALEGAGLRRDDVEILVATGLHRPNDADELKSMVGDDIAANYRIRNHVARDAAAHVHLGRTPRGTEIWIDRGFVDADLKIVAGLIEPHLMAGYSGGRKAVAPGLAGVATMRSAHGPVMLEDNVGPGIVDGNPFHEDLLEIARRVGVDFMVDVAVDRARRLTGVFAGDLEAAHAAGVRFVESHVRADVDEAADVVLTSAGGYPLDDTFYQSIKGLTGALNVVRRGGTIILAAAVREGLGSDDFQDLLRGLRDPEDFMRRIRAPGFFRIDQWMVQHLCQVLRKAAVIVASDAFAAGVPRPPLVDVAPSVDAALQQALQRAGTSPRLAVIPQGPYVLATVRGRRYALGQAWREGQAAALAPGNP
jgi:nickel-dependent lactate racemase